MAALFRSRSWRSKAVRGLLAQAIVLALIAAAVAYLLGNTLQNMRVRGIQSGFDFLLQPAGFAIGESILPFDSSDSYGKAFVIGLSNTFRVALVGIALATVLGTLMGVARLSRNALLRALAAGYVDLMRNVPLLLQLFIWYFVLTEYLPPVEQAWQPLQSLYLSKNGLQFPHPVWAPGHAGTVAGLAVGGVGAWGWVRRVRRHRETAGGSVPALGPALVIVLLCSLAGWWLGGAPSAVDRPELTAISVVGGGALTPEYLTVLLGLSTYTAAYIAEIVRAGIQSVPYGQHEAAWALGLSRAQELRQVVLPQALRVIIPPTTNQYLNLTKNSSLAVAVGYPDLVSVSTTSLNQTGRAIECIAIAMACYLALSLLTSAVMNVYNRRAAIRER